MLIPRTPKLYKHKGRWNIVFYDPHTQRQKWLSLGTGDKAAAERRARPMIEEYERGRFNPWTDTWTSGTRIADALERFAARPDLRPRSVSNTRNLVGRLLAVLPAGATFQMVADSDVKRLVMTPKSTDGKHSYQRTLSAFFSWCMKRGLASDNPAARIVLQKKVRRAPHFLTREQADHLLETERDAEIRGLIRFALASGLRRGELVTLRYSDVDLGGGTIRVRGEVAKGHADRIVPLGAWARTR